MILKLQNPSIIIIIIYRLPSCLDCDFIDVISQTEQYILTIPAPLPNIILLGDFNFPLINWSNPNSQCPLSSPLFNLSDHLFLSQQVAKPTSLLINCSDILAPPLKLMFSQSLTQGIFPSALKRAVIVPILKSGDKSIPGNHRPISLTSWCMVPSDLIFPSQEVTVTQGLVVEYVCMSETQ